MTSITQTIPNYVSGISEQPDELKTPGQLTVAKNVLPDVTQGLVKRPGGKLIGDDLGAYTTSSKWFHYYRDENEQYIGQIQGSDGQIKMWRCNGITINGVQHNAGDPVNVTDNLTITKAGSYARDGFGVITVTLTTDHGYSVGDLIYLDLATYTNGAVSGVYKVTSILTNKKFTVDGEGTVLNGITVHSAKSNYLIHLSDQDLQTLTLNDFTYITNRNKTVAMSDTVEPIQPPQAFIELKKVAYASQYAVNLYDDNTTEPIKTATRLSVHESWLSNESSCPNVGTKIFNVGSNNIHNKTQFVLKDIKIGGEPDLNLVHSDGSENYKLIYCPPEWTTGTYYREGDLVTGRPGSAPENAHQSVYKLTNIANNNHTASGSNPPTATGGGDTILGDHTWTHISDTIYTADSEVTSSQIYSGKPVLMLNPDDVDGEGVSASGFASWINALSVGAVPDNEYSFDDFPFTFEGNGFRTETIDDSTQGFGSVLLRWKNEGDYTTHLNRIIVRSTGHTLYLGGSNIASASNSALKTNFGEIANSSLSYSTIGANRSDLYFRLTTTGQAVPDKNGSNYSCRYTTTIDLLHGGKGWTVGDYVQVEFNNGIYSIKIDEISESQVQANLGLIRPTPTSFDSKSTVTADSILGSIRKALIDDDSNTWSDDSENEGTNSYNGYQVKQIGNGLYITRPSNIVGGEEQNSFSVSTPVSELLNVLTTEVKDVADLPKQCKHGYVVKVANSQADEDDYYVKFFGNDGKDGDGVWEECPKPGVKTTLNPATMPIELKRKADGTFEVNQITWDPALVGDTAVDGTNPQPSFVGKTINKILFFRNRLVMLSDENVIMSRPGDFFNFWAKSAITFTATDNIDLSCSSEFPAIVYDGIQVNSGLVLFTKNQQFMLTTDSDVLSPLTAKINSLSSYNFNFKTNPFSLGTTIAFLDNAGKYNRFWEMLAVLREGEPNVIEQSKAISKSFSSDIDMVANSRENQVIFFGKKGTNKLYGFRYHTTSSKRIQQAWFTWELSGEIQHIAMLDDALFAIIKDGTKYTMQRFSIRGLSDSIYITDDRGTDSTTDDLEYKVNLDNARVIPAASLGYSSSTGRTGFTLPTNFDETSTNNLAVFCHSAGDDNGRYTKQVSIVGTGVNANIEFSGDWTGSDITVGYLYDMEIQFPTIYLQQQSNEQFRSQIHSSLVIHRVKLSLGPSGYYETTVARVGKSDFIQEDQATHEAPVADNYNSDRVAINNVLKQTVPVYEKNTNLTLTLKSTHPTPATLYSMTWEGDYTNKFYKSV
tara:strand:+ start:2530 stop:6360 length:3831 start_codon:yes stop_codon:yes gene_type:complete